MKRVLTLFLILAMVMTVTAVPMTGFAAYSESATSIDFTAPSDATSDSPKTVYGLYADGDANTVVAGTADGDGILMSEASDGIEMVKGNFSRSKVLKFQTDFKIGASATSTSGDANHFQIRYAGDVTLEKSQSRAKLFSIDSSFRLGNAKFNSSMPTLSKDVWYTMVSYIDSITGKQSIMLKERDTVGAEYTSYLIDNSVVVSATQVSGFAGVTGWSMVLPVIENALGFRYDNMSFSSVSSFADSFTDADTDADKIAAVESWANTGLISLPDYYDELTAAQKENFAGRIATANGFTSVTAFAAAAAAIQRTDYVFFSDVIDVKFDNEADDDDFVKNGTSDIGAITDGAYVISPYSDNGTNKASTFTWTVDNSSYSSAENKKTQVFTFDYKTADKLTGNQGIINFKYGYSSGNKRHYVRVNDGKYGVYGEILADTWYSFRIEFNPELGLIYEYIKAADDSEYTLAGINMYETADNLQYMFHIGLLWLQGQADGNVYLDNLKIQTLEKTFTYTGSVTDVPSDYSVGKLLATINTDNANDVYASVVDSTTGKILAAGDYMDANSKLLIHTYGITGQAYDITFGTPIYDVKFYYDQAELTDYNSETSVTAKLTVDSETAHSNIMFLVAMYDKDTGVLLSVDTDVDCTDASFEGTVNVPDGNTSTKIIKAYVWNTDLVPYRPVVSVE